MVNLLIISLLILVALLYIKIAEKFNIIDKPNHRSSHLEPTIRGAGILFYIAAVAYFFISGFNFPLFFLGLTLIAIVSYIDDLVSLNFKIRLLFQLIAISLVVYQLMIANSLGWFYLLFLGVFGLGFVNIYNFMDGINGITALYSITVFLGLYIINDMEEIVDQRFLSFMILSILVFGFFNFRKKARFFCGDVGSISIALILFFLVTIFTVTLKSLLIPLLTVVYVLDGCLTILYRKYLGENITEAHRYHIYQKLTDIKRFSHLKTAFLYSFVQCIVLIFIIYGFKLDLSAQLSIFIIVLLVLLGLYFILFKWLASQN